eukprot:6181195-Pleurochrysis_carterae.AAC.3
MAQRSANDARSGQQSASAPRRRGSRSEEYGNIHKGCLKPESANNIQATSLAVLTVHYVNNPHEVQILNTVHGQEHKFAAVLAYLTVR